MDAEATDQARGVLVTPEELVMIGPYFREGERFLNGHEVDWSTISYETMFYLRMMREYLGEPIALIRGAHPNRPSAVDACCPNLSLGEVFMGLTRIQKCSWGIYSGGSFHLDTREFPITPARWLAVKDQEEGDVYARGLASWITSRKDGWLYLSYTYDALKLVIELAENRR